MDVILTMNVDRPFYEASYAARMKEYFEPLQFLNGEIRIHPVCDTLQVKDYSRYEIGCFSEEHKKAVNAEQFPMDIRLAYGIGAGSHE